jgi:hypothetical protein
MNDFIIEITMPAIIMLFTVQNDGFPSIKTKTSPSFSNNRNFLPVVLRMRSE